MDQSSPRIVYAIQSAHITRGRFAGQVVEVGEAWDGTDPFVAEHPDLFSDAPTRGVRSTRTASGLVEQATARPGERRATRRA